MSAGDAPDPHEPTRLSDHGPLPPVPADVSRRLRDTFRPSLPIVSATLVADTRLNAQMAGTRGGADSIWTLSYRAGACDVIVDVFAAQGAAHLSGQFFGPHPDAVLRLYRNDEFTSIATTDEYGQFDLGTVECDVYNLALLRSDHVIELEIDVNERPTT